jgi:hypothetical protein
VCILKLVAENVVLTDYDIGPGELAQKTRIEVRGHDLSLWTNLLSQPAHNRPVARPNFKAAPARIHARDLADAEA